jgi:putative inorganic carbon (hco3(-)) transporter
MLASIRKYSEQLHLDTPLGYLGVATFGLMMAIVVSKLGLVLGAAAVVGLVGLPVLLLCMFNQQFGVTFMITIAFCVQFVAKYTEAPIGTSLDGLLVIMIFGILVGITLRRDWTFAKDPISTWLLIWVYFNLAQGLNPYAESRLAWVYTVRSVAVLNMLYFVACYAFSSLGRIKFMLKLVIVLTFITCLWGFKQEFLGLNPAEKAWLYADKERFQLFFQWGRIRVFSLLSDAMTFGIMMVYMSAFCLIMAGAPLKIWKRISLVVIGLLMVWVTVYTGTRTCYVLFPIALAYYSLLTFSWQKVALFVGFILIGTPLVLKSSSNPLIYRIQSAFRPSVDASVQVRVNNQKRIQPYIHSHPIGFGLGSTGLWAQRFTPDSFLAHFAHDSYYVRLAVETGWLGLILYMIFFATVMRRGIYFYLRVKDPTIKTMYCGLLVALFILGVANYPQEAIVQLPTSMVVYIFYAALVRLKDFDPHYQQLLAENRL